MLCCHILVGNKDDFPHISRLKYQLRDLLLQALKSLIGAVSKGCQRHACGLQITSAERKVLLYRSGDFADGLAASTDLAGGCFKASLACSIRFFCFKSSICHLHGTLQMCCKLSDDALCFQALGRYLLIFHFQPSKAAT